MDWRAVTLAVLVVCAGCPGLAEDDSARETVTPASVPDRVGESYGPVSAGGVVPSSTLVRAHEQAIGNQSYTLVIERTRLSDGDRRYRQRVVATVDGDTYRIRVSNRSRAGADNRTTVAIGTGNGTVVYERTEDGPFRRHNRSDVEVPTGAAEISRALEAVYVEPADAERIGDHAYRLSATEPRNVTARLGPDDRLAGVEFTGEVSTEGRFRTLDWRFTVDRGGTNVTAVSKLDVGRIGWTTVNTTPPGGNESVSAGSP